MCLLVFGSDEKCQVLNITLPIMYMFALTKPNRWNLTNST